MFLSAWVWEIDCSTLSSLTVGVGGLDGDGDIYRPDNLREFQTFVLKSTGGRGVHFVMADGVSVALCLWCCHLAV